MRFLAASAVALSFAGGLFVTGASAAASVPSAIALGGDSGCALFSGGTVDCWGDNFEGQLGIGATSAGSSTPVAVKGLSGAIGVSAGDRGACALLSGGTVKCWGDNSDGQLGNGTRTSSLLPVAVKGLSGATAVSKGHSDACALLSRGTVKCWGFNLGVSNRPSSTPIAVSGITTASAISTGESSSCAVLSGGTVRCWGNNSYGMLGNGATSSPLFGRPVGRPAAVKGISTAKAVSVGVTVSCALLSGGTVKCWGLNNSGQLGTGKATSGTVNAGSSTAVAVKGLSGAIGVSAGAHGACALLSGGTVKCWGDGQLGQLGNGTTNLSPTPVAVEGL